MASGKITDRYLPKEDFSSLREGSGYLRKEQKDFGIVDLGSATLLGFVQGLTEFLPVSSSGHLVLMQLFIPGFHQPGVLFDVFLHGATLIAVLVYFRHDLVAIGLSSLSGTGREVHSGWSPVDSRRLIVHLVVGTVPAGIVGIFFRESVASIFHTSSLVGPALMVTGGILYLEKRFVSGDTTIDRLGVGDVLIIGFAQTLALIPGISRSGITIIAGMNRGLRGEEAVKFSFFLSLPAILGAVLLEGIKGIPVLPEDEIGFYATGCIVSLVSGLFAIWVLMKVVQRRRLRRFAWYCWGAGLAAIFINMRIG